MKKFRKGEAFAFVQKHRKPSLSHQDEAKHLVQAAAAGGISTTQGSMSGTLSKIKHGRRNAKMHVRKKQGRVRARMGTQRLIKVMDTTRSSVVELLQREQAGWKEAARLRRQLEGATKDAREKGRRIRKLEQDLVRFKRSDRRLIEFKKLLGARRRA